MTQEQLDVLLAEIRATPGRTWGLDLTDNTGYKFPAAGWLLASNKMLHALSDALKAYIAQQTAGNPDVRDKMLADIEVIVEKARAEAKIDMEALLQENVLDVNVSIRDKTTEGSEVAS